MTEQDNEQFRIKDDVIEINGEVMLPESEPVEQDEAPNVDFNLEEIAENLHNRSKSVEKVDGVGNFLTASVVAGYLTEKPYSHATISVDTINALATSVAEGATMAECCRRAGIKVDTFYTWLRKGDKDLDDKKQTMYTLLVECLKLASGFYQTNMLAQVQSHGAEDWRALVWILERRWPELYGQHRLSSEEAGGGSEKLEQETIIRKYTSDQWEAL